MKELEYYYSSITMEQKCNKKLSCRVVQTFAIIQGHLRSLEMTQFDRPYCT